MFSLAACAFTLAAKGIQAPIFSDDFEDYVVGAFPYRWELWYEGMGVDNQTVVDYMHVSPWKSLQLYGRSDLPAVAARHFSSVEDKIGYTAFISPSWSCQPAVGFAKNVVGGIRTYAQVRFKPVEWHSQYPNYWGDIVTGGGNQGGNETLLGTYNPEGSPFHEIKVILEKSSKKYSVWIDGRLVASDLETYYDPSEIEGLALSNEYGGLDDWAYFDDIQITEETLPVPEFPLGSVIPIAVIPLLFYVWRKRKQKTS